MLSDIPSSTRRAGFRAALLATLFSVFYVVAQLAEWVGWFGSAGGPESASTPLGIFVLLTPSLLLGPAFVVMLVALDLAVPLSKKVWSRSAVAFAIAYLVLIAMNYFVQLTWVAPRMAEGRIEGLEPFLFEPFDSFLYSVDLLGYSFMSVATLCAGYALGRDGLEGTARRFLIANGLLLPFLVGQLYVHWLIWPAVAWAVTFPGSTISVALLFRRPRATTAEPTSAEVYAQA